MCSFHDMSSLCVFIVVFISNFWSIVFSTLSMLHIRLCANKNFFLTYLLWQTLHDLLFCDISYNYTVVNINLWTCNEQLFSRVVCSNHCLFHLLEKDKSLFHMSLRPTGHSFDLPRYQYNLTRKFFIYRNLYSNK